ncbi:YbiU family protein [Aeromonas sp. A-5]|uniref:YbiU family protein n=1 Tax=Aeromonas ichthyocola TaxID=3367746 RepID=UPI0038DAB70D
MKLHNISNEIWLLAFVHYPGGKMSVTHTQLPAYYKAAIRQMKQALRAQLGDVEAVFAEVSRRIEARVAEVEALRARGEPVWPELDYQALVAGQVGEVKRAAIRRRGCLVILRHFARERALAWIAIMPTTRISTVSMSCIVVPATVSAPLPRRAPDLSRSTGRCRDGGTPERRDGDGTVVPAGRLWQFERPYGSLLRPCT